jgi:hypothetical protein
LLCSSFLAALSLSLKPANTFISEARFRRQGKLGGFLFCCCCCCCCGTRLRDTFAEKRAAQEMPTQDARTASLGNSRAGDAGGNRHYWVGLCAGIIKQQWQREYFMRGVLDIAMEGSGDSWMSNKASNNFSYRCSLNIHPGSRIRENE